jgi:hypothetical protein
MRLRRNRHRATAKDAGSRGVPYLVLAALSLGVPPAAHAEASYVALGDSYTSGFGIVPLVPTAPPECGQSTLNYPHLVASELNLALTDVSCGGAKTENFTVAQYPDQPPQFDALTPTTEVGMGGNDHNLFIDLLQGCTETDAGKPNEGAPCKDKYASFVKQTFKEDQLAAEAAFAEARALSPLAKVFVVGYPEITPENGYCPAAIPWTTGDLQWFRDGVTRPGNALIKRVARAHGAIYVNTFRPSEGHNACEPLGVRWIEPLIGALTFAMHPNATGQEHDAIAVTKAMRRAGIR